MADLLTISSHQFEGTVTIELDGELDLHGSPPVAAAIREALGDRPESIDVDTARLAFIDSAGLRTLLSAWQEAKDSGVRLRIVKASPAVERILAMTGAGAVLLDDGPEGPSDAPPDRPGESPASG